MAMGGKLTHQGQQRLGTNCWMAGVSLIPQVWKSWTLKWETKSNLGSTSIMFSYDLIWFWADFDIMKGWTARNSRGPTPRTSFFAKLGPFLSRAWRPPGIFPFQDIKKNSAPNTSWMFIKWITSSKTRTNHTLLRWRSTNPTSSAWYVAIATPGILQEVANGASHQSWYRGPGFFRPSKWPMKWRKTMNKWWSTVNFHVFF